MFPQADTRIREEAHTFLRRMKAVLDELGTFDTRITLEPPSDLSSSTVGFAPKADAAQDELMGIFVAWAHEYPLIRLQTIARWEPTWPTYETVRAAAESLFLPALWAYNREHKTRYRFRIDSREETLPKLTPKAQEAFDEFAHAANKESLHPLDWERFYRFVRVCYATGNDPYESDVVFFLRKGGFAPKDAEFVAQVFLHCHAFHISSDWRRELGYRRRNAPRDSRE